MNYKEMFINGYIKRITNEKEQKQIERYGGKYYLYRWSGDYIIKLKISKKKCFKILKRWNNKDCNGNILDGIYYNVLSF